MPEAKFYSSEELIAELDKFSEHKDERFERLLADAVTGRIKVVHAGFSLVRVSSIVADIMESDSKETIDRAATHLQKGIASLTGAAPGVLTEQTMIDIFDIAFILRRHNQLPTEFNNALLLYASACLGLARHKVAVRACDFIYGSGIDMPPSLWKPVLAATGEHVVDYLPVASLAMLKLDPKEAFDIFLAESIKLGIKGMEPLPVFFQGFSEKFTGALSREDFWNIYNARAQLVMPGLKRAIREASEWADEAGLWAKASRPELAGKKLQKLGPQQ